MNAPNNPSEDQDPAWELLKKASSQKASSRFTDDVLRSARLSQPDKARLSQRFRASVAIGLATLVAVAALYLSPKKPEPQVADRPINLTESLTALEDELGVELLGLAAEAPSLFTDDEIIDLIL